MPRKRAAKKRRKQQGKKTFKTAEENAAADKEKVVKLLRSIDWSLIPVIGVDFSDCIDNTDRICVYGISDV